MLGEVAVGTYIAYGGTVLLLLVIGLRVATL
jgi:hypothetical protein